jgi:N4-gp56 family major capsid protein
MSGISYAYTNNGKLRSSSTLANLAFAADVVAPSTNRSVMWNGTALIPSVTANVTSAFVPSYKMIVAAIAYAKSHYMKGIMDGGKEYFCMFVHPRTLAMLKVDDNYQRAVVTGLPRGTDNPFFTGGTVTIDGAVIHEHRLVYNTSGTATKWGAGNAIEGSRTLLCGAQSLGMADLGPAEWAEKLFQYDSSPGINIDKMFGLLKPQFYSIYDGSVEDFGILAIDHYLA